MDKNTIIANSTTIIGIGLCLAIAQLPISWSIGIMAVSTLSMFF